jgi:DNA polymerase III subunit epsilon
MIPIYFDTETTGTRPDKDQIIEIAAFDPQGERTFCSLVRPSIPIPPDATAIHGITEEMVSGAPSFKDVALAFTDFCGPSAVLIAHNGDAFDKPFLEQEFLRHKVPFPQWPFIDTLKWSRKYRPDLPRHALQHLREVYQVPANQAHRALDDVIVLYKIFSQMIDDLSLQTIMELLLAPSKTGDRMPFGKHQGKPLSEVPKDYVRWLMGSGAFDKAENAKLKESFVKLGHL